MSTRMKSEKTPASPSSDEATSQKQDPLEKRRLQNRLSQRNHRRKIRDRIAKLQERVITNELRAAAALNGWDQQFTPSPLTSTFHASHHDHNHNIGFLKSSMPMNTEPTTLSVPSFNHSPASSWSSDMTVPLSPTFMCGDSPCFTDGSSAFPNTISTAIPVSGSHGQIDMPPLMDSMLDTNILQDISATGNVFPSEMLNTPGNQQLCYTATEATLPHIIQVLSSMSPQSKIIVLVPHDPILASSAEYPSPTPTLTEAPGLELHQSVQTSSSHGLCPCQAQNVHRTSTTQMGSKPWTTPGSHQFGYSPRRDFRMKSG